MRNHTADMIRFDVTDLALCPACHNQVIPALHGMTSTILN